MLTSARLCPQNGSMYQTPASSESGESMNYYPANGASQELPAQADSPGATGHTAEAFGRLSFEHRRTASREYLASQRGRPLYAECHPLVSKRSASRELTKPGGRQSPRLEASPKQLQQAATWTAARCRAPAQRRPLPKRVNSYDQTRAQAPGVTHTHATTLPPRPQGNGVARPRDSVCDSGYATRQNTGPCLENADAKPDAPNNDDVDAKALARVAKQQAERRYTSADGQRLDMLLQPNSSPISTEQLAAEVKGIYAGLVMVEAKCINIDAAQAADPKSPLGAEQWQALIALHRTLLYEHHDFLMATQHPSATPALRGLAIKYSMPARMWKHGIHAFLEVLRHRRPQSQDYMLAFIYLAYQMMALLFETVPSFTDTWIECLGDLARYRMAVEEEKEAHATWGGVAARWYTMASDRHPAIGRLYHHLGILERPSLRKFCYYSKSLTCVVPFSNARDSLSTLCAPIVQDQQTIQSSRQSAEARIVTYHALIFTRRDLSTVAMVQEDSLQLLGDQPAKLRDFGAYFAAANIASLFQLGNPKNQLWQTYHMAIDRTAADRPNSLTKEPPSSLSQPNEDLSTDSYLQSSKGYLAESFNYVLQHYATPESFKHSLSYIHVTLAYLHSLHAARTRISSNDHQKQQNTLTSFLFWGLDFTALASFLTFLAQQQDQLITAGMLECARQGTFLASASDLLASSQQECQHTKPLSEDYVIRGHVWSQFYFSPGWFDGQGEDDGRSIETASMMTARAMRVLWLGLFLAFHTELLSYDVQSQVFSATAATTPATTTSIFDDVLLPTGHETSSPPESLHPVEADMASSTAVETTSVRLATSPTGTNGSSDSSEDGYTVVKTKGRQGCKAHSSPNGAKATPKKANGAKTSSKKTNGANAIQSKTKKDLQDHNAFQVVDENGEMVPNGQIAEALG
ncbi:hypothetical protein CB0940_08935 [Cercospora beticola]|uniref:Uncharacterized protein n=1 Tax=Cercospora beticola TaxID=122368 RepID=A0A2G5HR08_CERBT|nr:hypothetical protein CB0940_08935 [Cercospora beticola]PIA94986.1 hypothetical protein CB0940_08935 [Cercospora beticola]